MSGTEGTEPVRRPGVAIVAAIIALLVAGRAIWRAHGGYHPAELATLPPPTFRLDPNTATWAEIAALPGMGEAIAKRIVAYREQQCARGNARPFRALADLDAVSGIGPRTLEELEPYLQF